MPSSFSSSPKEIVPLALCCDRNVADGLAAVIISAAHHVRKGIKLHVYVVDCGLGEAVCHQLSHLVESRLPNVVLTFIPLDAGRLSHFPRPASLSHVTPAAFGRLFLHELLPEIDRVIYLDCDLLVTADVADLYFMDLDSQVLAAAIDTVIPTVGHERESLVADVAGIAPMSPYFNSGVILFDLQQLRRLDATSRYTEALRTVKARYADQSVLNAVFHGRWKVLAPSWNRQTLLGGAYTVFPDRSRAIWHFSSKLKPWHFDRTGVRGLVAQWFAENESTGWKPLAIPTERASASFAKDMVKWGRSWIERRKNDRLALGASQAGNERLPGISGPSE